MITAGDEHSPTGPYPGLRAFGQDETSIFFGRETQTDALLIKLRRSRFLAVVGPSGCGKSSLVRAGMIAGLHAGFLAEAGSEWRTAEIRPGDQPIARLANELVKMQALGKEQGGVPHAAAFIQAGLRRGPLGLVEVVNESLLGPETNLLVLVDQFEELFRYRSKGNVDEAEAFVALLLASCAQRDVPIYVVITMRSDFLGDSALFRGLPEAINDSQYLTPRLTREQIRAAIVGPAKVFSGDVEPALVNRLVNDVGPDSDQLPLLQHALMRMWERTALPGAQENPPVGTVTPRMMTVADYKAVGSLSNALSDHADEVLASLGTDQQRIAQVLFRCLAERDLGQRDTRRPAKLGEVAAVANVAPEAVASVVEIFRQPGRNFVTPPLGIELSPDTTLDIGHESLIRQWKRLNEWVNEEARSSSAFRRLCDRALLWKAGQAALLQGVDLDRALDWEQQQKPKEAWALRYGKLEEFSAAIEFLRASESEREQQRLREAKIERRDRNKTRAVIMLMLLIAILGAGFGVLSKKNAQQLEDSKARLESSNANLENQNRINNAGKLSAQARSRAARRVDQALLLAVEASHNDVAQARPGLLTSLLASPRFLGAYPGHADAARSVAVSHDGTMFASGGLDGIVLLRAIKEKGLWITPPMQGHNGYVYAVAFSPGGDLLASAGDDGRIVLWDTATGNPSGGALHGHTKAVSNVTFSPDGKRLVSSSLDNTVIVWDVAKRAKLVSWSGHAGEIYAIAISPDGKLIASGGAGKKKTDKRLMLWHADLQPKPAQMLAADADVYSLAFGKDGRSIVAGLSDGSVRMWNLEQPGKNPTTLGKHGDRVFGVAFSPKGEMLASVSADGTTNLWDAKEKKLLDYNLQGYRDELYGVAFSPDGSTLLAATGDGSVVFWDIGLQEPNHLAQPLDNPNPRSVAFSPDGKTFAATSNNDILLWDAIPSEFMGFQRLDKLTGHKSRVTKIAFDADGKHLVSGDMRGNIVMWNLQSKPREALSLDTQSAEIKSLFFSANGRRVFAGDTKGAIVATDSNGSRPTILASDSDGSEADYHRRSGSLALSPQGRQLAWPDDNAVVLWDVAANKQTAKLSRGVQRTVTTVAFSPDGKTLAAGTDSTVVFWDLETRTVRTVLLEHDKDVTALAFDPTGQVLATGSKDKTVRLWEVATGLTLGAPLSGYKGEVRELAFNHDGTRLASVDGEALMIWDLKPASWRSKACAIAGRNLMAEEIWSYRGSPETCAEGVMTEAHNSLLKGEADSARNKYQKAVDMAREWGDASINNSVCWYGALDGFEKVVMPACEKSVSAAKDVDSAFYRDSRGLARALAGDTLGAMDDFASFPAFLAQYEKQQKESGVVVEKQWYVLRDTRSAWIDALKAGKNPFDAKTIRALRVE